jgi:hypothetical protein
MTGRRLFGLASVAALLLPVGLASGTPAGRDGAASPAAKGPRIKSGRYGSGDVYMDVNVKKRTVSLHFTLYCNDLYADQYVSTGQRPSRGELKGNRVGAKVFVFGEYSGPAPSGPGDQVADWVLNGKFTRPGHFDGRIEYEAATFPEPTPPAARPQCIDAKLIHLNREPAGAAAINPR